MGLNALFDSLREQSSDVIVAQRVVSSECAWNDVMLIDDLAWAKMALTLETAVARGEVPLEELRMLGELFDVQLADMQKLAVVEHVSEMGYRSRHLHDVRLFSQQVRIMASVVRHILSIFEAETQTASERQKQAA